MLNRLKFLIQRGLIRSETPFTLADGSQSDYYVDCRRIALSCDGLQVIVSAIWTELFSLKVKYDAIGGPSVGADPIIGGMLFYFGFFTGPSRNLRGFLVRSDKKEHGDPSRIIGPIQKGDKCVLIDDVVTSGNSCLSAAQELEGFGCKVVQIISVVDRLQGAAELFAKHNYPYKSLLTIKDLEIDDQGNSEEKSQQD